jgi:hypothetical protein
MLSQCQRLATVNTSTAVALVPARAMATKTFFTRRSCQPHADGEAVTVVTLGALKHQNKQPLRLGIAGVGAIQAEELMSRARESKLSGRPARVTERSEGPSFRVPVQSILNMGFV